jgi:hypothetical protein
VACWTSFTLCSHKRSKTMQMSSRFVEQILNGITCNLRSTLRNSYRSKVSWKPIQCWEVNSFLYSFLLLALPPTKLRRIGRLLGNKFKSGLSGERFAKGNYQKIGLFVCLIFYEVCWYFIVSLAKHKQDKDRSFWICHMDHLFRH